MNYPVSYPINKKARFFMFAFFVVILSTFLMANNLIVSNSLAATNASETVLHANATSKKFHNQSCRYYDCKQCTVIFKSREEALKAGYAACKVCKG